MDYGAVSDPGRVRDNNEDCYTVLTETDKVDIIAVADGMGGHNAGEVASSLAIKTVQNYKFSTVNLNQNIKECIAQANEEIWSKAQQKSDYQGMGTTLTLGIITGDSLEIGHVGDSRAYLYSQGLLSQLTVDHSYTGELVRNDLITQEEAAEHPKRNLLTRALGIEKKIQVDTKNVELQTGDLLLFCSDGITEMLPEEKIIDILMLDKSLSTRAEALIEAANKAGGYDNITVVVYRHS